MSAMPLVIWLPGAHRHGEPGLLQRRDVVDAVADHRREAAPVGERADQRLLLVRGDPAEDRVSLGGVRRGPACRRGARAPRSRRRRRGRRPRGRPRSRSGGRRRRSASGRPAGRAGTRSSRRRRGAAAPRARPGRAASSCGGGWRAGIARERAPRVSPKATTRRPAAVCCSRLRWSAGGELEGSGLAEHVGRAQHVAAGEPPPVERQAAPLPRRRERDLGDDPLAAWPG